MVEIQVEILLGMELLPPLTLMEKQMDHLLDYLKILGERITDPDQLLLDRVLVYLLLMLLL